MDLRATGGRVCLSEIHGSLAQGLLLYKDEIRSVEGPDAGAAPKEPPVYSAELTGACGHREAGISDESQDEGRRRVLEPAQAPRRLIT